MKLDNKVSINALNDEFNISDEIDLNQILNILKRNKKFIANIASIGLILGGFIAFTTKNTWKGDFQIVLEQDNKEMPLAGLNPSLAGLAGLGKESNKLKTEVEILKSPSVLMEIFQYVKEKKIYNNKKYEKLRFRKWMEDLNIQLADRTTILNISYKDKDKDLILPVLNKISSKYQQYSGRERVRNFELGIEYFKNQLEIYKEKSKKSMLKADNYASEQRLSLVLDKFFENQSMPFVLDVEEIRLKANAELKFVNQMLEMLKNNEDDITTIYYIAERLNVFKDNTLIEKLEEINVELSYLRSRYYETDESIKMKNDEKDIILKLLSKQIKGILLSKEEEAKSQLIEAKRPGGVEIKYKQLLYESARDMATLQKLEKNYSKLSLEKARYQDPWELITNPTLDPDPVSPKKARILIFGLLGGLFLGSSIAVFKEKRENKIYTSLEFETLSKMSLIAEIDPLDKKNLDEVLTLLISNILESEESDIAVLKVGNIENVVINLMQEYFDANSKRRKVSIIENIKEIHKYPSVIVLTQLGITKRNEIIDLRKKINLQNKNLLGILMLGQPTQDF